MNGSPAISVEFAKKRLERARQREIDAMREKRLAMTSLEIEEARLAAWIAENPEPQMELPGVTVVA
jgi:post-segregation antitoxin (ccd killing protein)